MKPEEFPSDSTCTWPSLLATRQRIHLFIPTWEQGPVNPASAESRLNAPPQHAVGFSLNLGLCVKTLADQVLPGLGPTLSEPSDLLTIFCVYCFQFMYRERIDNGQILTPLHVTTVCGGKGSGEMFWQKELQVQNFRAKKSTALLGHCRFFRRSGFWKASVEVEGKEGARPRKDLDVTLERWNFSFPQANRELLKNSKKAIASLHNLDFVKKEILPQWQCEKWT